MIIAIVAMVIVILIIIAIINNSETAGHWTIEAPEKQAGRYGEYIATEIIKGVLREGDYLFTNISVSYDGKSTELDNVVVNKYGVFIFEVKNYKGILYGTEDDYNWKKYKEDGYGNVFAKEVRNPIRQVKRQIYILAKYLQCFNVWVEGYVILIQGNNPIESTYLLQNVEELDRVIHTYKRNHLSKYTVEEIRKMFV